MRHAKLLFLGASAALLLSPAAGWAGPATQLNSEILNKLHAANAMEISAGKLAKKRGTTAAIRQFGQQLIEDHTRADKQVVALAKALNVNLAKPAGDRAIDNLANLHGRDFDSNFSQMMVTDHDDAIQFVRSSLERVDNADVSALLKQLLPTLESHRTTAVGLAATVT
jgi:putative membrane protein